MQNIIRENVKVSDLKNGDTVEVNGKLETVNYHHLKNGPIGATCKGDPHRLGICKVTFKVPTAFGYRCQ